MLKPTNNVHLKTEITELKRKAAGQGDADAQYNLGVKYFNGEGVSQDDTEAVKCFRKAAEQGNINAQTFLGYMYTTGRGVIQNYSEAVKWHRKAAEQGNATAQYNLGAMYSNGQGVPQDEVETVKWYRKAAEQGFALAQYYLGVKYSNGQGVPQDDTEAAIWYRKAAGQGHAEAVKWYREAAEQGHADAQFNLGMMYDNGEGVPEDDEEAVRWYREAAEQGHADAQFNLGMMYDNGEGVPEDDEEAVRWYREAAEQGHADAQFILGMMYDNGEGVPEDDEEAVRWYREAAEQGHADAQFYLGMMYDNGEGVPEDDEEAVRWYREAAEQGHQDAQNNLETLLGKDFILSQEDEEEDEKADDTYEIQKQTISEEINCSPGIEECKPLLEACTPLVYIDNAFRITGLFVDASTRNVKRRIDDLKSAHELGDTEEEYNHAFALNPVPDLDKIRESSQRLQDPEHRIVEEFFWFWPLNLGECKTDKALIALKNNDKQTPQHIWKEAVLCGHAEEVSAAKHNLAVIYHLVALDFEQKALEGTLSPEKLTSLSQCWRSSFKYWEELVEDETFWSLVSQRIRNLDDPRLTTGFTRRMRATLPEALDKINAELAKRYIEKGELKLAQQHIVYMKETHQGLDDVPKTLAMITQPLQTRIRNAIEEANRIREKEPEEAAQAAFDLFQAVSQPVEIIRNILPPDDHDYIDLCDATAEAGLACQIAYARETEDWDCCLDILDGALEFAVSSDLKNRFSENKSVVENNRLFKLHLEPLTKILKDLESKKSIADRMLVINNIVLPQLRKIERLPDISVYVYNTCADMVANFIRGLSVSIFNEKDDLPESLRILDIAIATARGDEAKSQLQKDKVQLLDIKAEAIKYNLQINIRSDTIEVKKEFVRYNDKSILSSQIQGIRFGVYIQYNNGVRSSSYLIGIAGGGVGSISIECKRFFRSEDQAERDFNQILQALSHQIFPSLIQRIAKSIVAGYPQTIGNCRITAKGAYVTTGMLMWKKETFVPFSNLRFGFFQGVLNVSSSTDQSIKDSMSLRDTWNAVLFEYIVNAVIQLKS